MPFIRFQPIYQERVWGGRQLETLYDRPLPVKTLIGESWELVDRAEAQSRVISDEFHNQTLHELWLNHRETIFGQASPQTERFPLLIKILDAQAKLSVQVHPTLKAAQLLGSEPKTEAWYFIETQTESEVFLGLKTELDKIKILEKIKNQTFLEELNRYSTHSGDVAWVPTGCIHAIGEGNLILEVQQNADTTYRLFDWNRVTASGQPRELHLDQALQALSYDPKPLPPRPLSQTPLVCEFFSMEQLTLNQTISLESKGDTFTLIFLKEGSLQWGDDLLAKGEMGLISASYAEVELQPLTFPTIAILVRWGK